jgi:phage terminase large subunit-like protein
LTPETSLGFEVAEFARDILEIDLLPWQKWLFVHGLELNPDRSYRFRKVLVLVPRQCGKTTALMVLSLWRMVMDSARTVLGTSTNLDYAKEAWQKAVELAWGPPESKHFAGVSMLEGIFTKPRLANGEQTLSTVDGARYKIGTASRTGGRSLSIDLAIMDELREHKTFAAWAAASKTTNARPRGQVWALSNMGDDTSVVLNHFQQLARDQILKGEVADPALAMYEYSAPEGCDTADRSFWPVAIPALGYTISETTIASDQKSDPEEVFRTEVLCQRVPTLEPLPITLDMWWSAVRNRKRLTRSSPVFGVSVSPSQRTAAIVVAVMASRNIAHLELVYHGPMEAVVGRMQKLAARYDDAQFVMVQTGAMAALLPDLLRAEIEPIQVNTTDLGRAYGHMQKRLQDRQLTHDGNEAFEDALLGAVKRDVGEGLWSLGWRKATSDLTPLEAGAIALWQRAGEEDPDPNVAGFY